MTSPPVFAVVGTTGVGKSLFAVELARAIDGEIINADSMQVYKGLDIATNKAPVAERGGIQHHLMDFLDPCREYSVTEFKRDAIETINSIHARNRIPILVGGTNYYIQSLLWKQNLLAAPTPSEGDTRHTDLAGHPLAARIGDALAAKMANRLHERNDRKIRRSLEVFYTTGKPHSEWLNDQQRYPTCIFWLYADSEQLNPRLDARVGDMIKLGLFAELSEMRDKVSAGEFDAYLTSLSASPPIDPPALEALRATSVEEMMRATRRYARRQVTWIRNKLAPMSLAEMGGEEGKDMGFFLLDASSLEEWKARVSDLGISLAKTFLAQAPLPSPQSLSSHAAALLPAPGTPARLPPQTKRTCPVCVDRITGAGKVLTGDKEWEVHLATRIHLRNSRSAWRRGKPVAGGEARGADERAAGPDGGVDGGARDGRG
ncbi:IPP transferase-domain-containing protein [Blyttiomyces helicus]|uniref:tRNA dimethylallyltransferase n=1 Tax=Blyttiomyces helicus TaxID=388810 RepID=A0A4P9W6J2_9FUNG|nr:IPP transferase-domain-containing protein [Blyttiomyces helicus]|eukprot:RKO87612.1 IPP transferase-domain-containing protein [Blyttiomyces helicus]